MTGGTSGNRQGKRRPGWTRAELDRLVEEATVDCYNESEQSAGLYAMIDEYLVMPFETLVLGAPVVVERVELDLCNEIMAVCRRGRERQRISLLDLLLPSPPPAGVEWIAAYRHWRYPVHGRSRL
jgi:hypothetical protein